jgi:hypothetical protein
MVSQQECDLRVQLAVSRALAAAAEHRHEREAALTAGKHAAEVAALRADLTALAARLSDAEDRCRAHGGSRKPSLFPLEVANRIASFVESPRPQEVRRLEVGQWKIAFNILTQTLMIHSNGYKDRAAIAHWTFFGSVDCTFVGNPEAGSNVSGDVICYKGQDGIYYLKFVCADADEAISLHKALRFTLVGVPV